MVREMEIYMEKQKDGRFAPWLFVIIGAGAYISLIFNQNVWLDEAFTASLVRTDYAGVLARSASDTLPPLYNLLLKFMTDVFGYSVPVMKLTSVLPMIGTLVLAATVVRRRFGDKTACLWIVMLTGMPLMLYYGMEIRMYSLGFFFATASGVYAYEVVRESSTKNWILFTIVSVLAGYSHHFAFVTVGFVYLFLLLYYIFFEKSHIRRWFFCLLATLVLYAPCAVVTLRQLQNVSGYFAMPDVTFYVFIKYMVYPFIVGVTPVTVILLAVEAFLLLRFLVRFIQRQNHTSDDIYSFLCFVIFYGVLVFGTIVSKVMTANIFVDRYLFFSVGLLWLFAAIQVQQLPIRSQYVAWVLFTAVFACSYLVEYRIEYADGAPQTKAYLEENESKNLNYIYTVEESEELAWCLPFYGDYEEFVSCKNAGDFAEGWINVEDLTEAITLWEGSGNAGKLWIAVMDSQELSKDDRDIIAKAGYRLGEQKTLQFDRYVCNLTEVNK